MVHHRLKLSYSYHEYITEFEAKKIKLEEKTRSFSQLMW